MGQHVPKTILLLRDPLHDKLLFSSLPVVKLDSSSPSQLQLFQ